MHVCVFVFVVYTFERERERVRVCQSDTQVYIYSEREREKELKYARKQAGKPSDGSWQQTPQASSIIISLLHLQRIPLQLYIVKLPTLQAFKCEGLTRKDLGIKTVNPKKRALRLATLDSLLSRFTRFT
jgi:hypothetical protein